MLCSFGLSMRSLCQLLCAASASSSGMQLEWLYLTSYCLLLLLAVLWLCGRRFPAGSKASRTRKWLHMDDLSGGSVFRHQMSMVRLHRACCCEK